MTKFSGKKPKINPKNVPEDQNLLSNGNLNSNTKNHMDDSLGEKVTVTWLERKLDATPNYKSVSISQETKNSLSNGLKIIERPTNNSESKSIDFFKWFIWPLPYEEFFSSYWEKKVCLIKRNIKNYWDGWFSSEKLRELVNQKKLSYGQDIDIALYKNEKRHTLNISSDQPVDSDVLWDLFEKLKCSVRVLRPQEYSDNVSRMLALLEEIFLSGFGSNAYYTPAGSQGFAPHWDDVEVFLIQVEGRKHWKIHQMSSQDEILPRFSSRNFKQEDIGEPILEAILEPGDILYMPKGTIHQAMADPDSDSFHLTISCCQKNSWADLLDVALSASLTEASKTMPEFRESLPHDYGNYMGVMYSDLENNEKRKQFITRALALSKAFTENFLPQLIDDSADIMMCKFLYDRQPPQSILSIEEQGLEPGKNQEENKSDNLDSFQEQDDDEVTLKTNIRLVSKHCIRLMVEENASVYYATQNSAIYHQVDSQKIPMPLEYAEAVEYLCKKYPKYVSVSELPLEDDEQKLEITNELLDHQIAMIE